MEKQEDMFWPHLSVHFISNSSKILEAMIEFKALYTSLGKLSLNFMNAVSDFCNK